MTYQIEKGHDSDRDRPVRDEIEVTLEMIGAGKQAFYSVLDMPPFSDATVTDLVFAIACALMQEFPYDK